MRKFWFVYPAKALVVFPGGFGTMDEMFEVLTLIQTRMPRKKMPVVLFGTEFWDDIINFEALNKWGVISPEDLNIFHKTDSVDDAFEYLRGKLEELYLKPQGLDEVKLT
jgi:predicted Rossmann-fold nucleotide-binding protein